MRMYIAARYDRIAEMNGYADQLQARGHLVTCRWLNGTHQLHPNPELVDAPAREVPMAAQPFAWDDYEDVRAADVLLFFSEPPESHSKRGGRHVEFGLALGWGKRLILIGPRENVFHCLPQVEQFGSFADAVKVL